MGAFIGVVMGKVTSFIVCVSYLSCEINNFVISIKLVVNCLATLNVALLMAIRTISFLGKSLPTNKTNSSAKKIEEKSVLQEFTNFVQGNY